MTNRRIYYTLGTILCLIAASFLVSAFTRPVLSFPWPAFGIVGILLMLGVLQ